jgi:hypothetical protein
MSTLQTTTSTDKSSLSPAVGDTYFETDTKNIIVYDGTNWRGYQNDGQSVLTATFDGTDDRVDLGTISSLSSASAFSITAWFKVPTTSDQNGNIFGSVDFDDGVGLKIAYVSGGTYIDATIGKGGSAYAGRRFNSGFSSSYDLFDNAWHHIAMVYNGSSITLYVDNSSSSGFTDANIGTAVPTSTLSGAGADSRIASRGDAASTFFFEGSLDDVAIFNAALTSTQIADIYNNDTYADSVQHRYTFDTNFNDSVGGSHGTGESGATAGVSDLR